MDASEVLYSTPATAANALSFEMSLTPTAQTQQLPTPLSPLATFTTTSQATAATTPTTPRTTTHTPREIPTMYILDQMYDDYMDQYNGNNITTPTEVPDTNTSLELVACPICARTFNPVTLRKHVGICEKMTTKKRNIFDSSRQRREGTDLATYPLPKNFGLPEKATSSTSIVQARNERGQSPKPAAQQVCSPILTRKKPAEDLIRSTARASMRKTVTTNNTTPTAAAAATSTSTSNATPASNFNRDRMRSSERSLTRSRGIQPLPAEQCPHCERCFGIKAYDRHVEWCKEKALQAAIKQGSSKNDGNVAKARLEARTKYRAPCLKTKRSLNREKYSGVAGEEHEIYDSSKCSKTNGNKTQDNSLMSMSMTSSICSERKIQNSSTTGNINEPAATKAATNSSYYSVGSRKCTRDKCQTSQPPTTTNKLNNTALTTAAAATENAQKQEEPIINLEIQMPQLYLMGEQMSATAINKNRRTQIKLNNAVTAAKIKAQKEQKLKQQQPTEFVKKQQLQMKSKSCNQKLKTTADVRISLPVLSTALEQKKSSSDLCLQSMRCDKRLQALHKAFESDYDLKDPKHHVDNNVYDHDEVKFEATEAPADNLDLTKSLTFYGSMKKKEKESEKILTGPVLQIKEKLDEPPNKMTMEEYFDNKELFCLEEQQHSQANCSKFKNEDNDFCKSLILGSKKLLITGENDFFGTQKHNNLSQLKYLQTTSYELREDQLQILDQNTSSIDSKKLLITRDTEHCITQKSEELSSLKDLQSTSCELRKDQFQDLDQNTNPTGSKILLITRDNEHCGTQKSEDLSSLKDLKFQELIMQQSYPSQQHYNADGYDSEELVEINNSIILSVPKLDIPKSPSIGVTKQQTLTKTLKKSLSSREMYETEERDCNKESKQQKDYLKLEDNNNQTFKSKTFTQQELSESEIYNDCLTDSDELRLLNMSTPDNINIHKNIKKETEKEHLEVLENPLIKDKSWEMDLKPLKSCSKSYTFIRDLEQTSYQLINLKDNYGKLLDNQKPLKLSKSSLELSCFKTKSRKSSPTKRNTTTKSVMENNDTPRTPTSLRLPRLSTPPPTPPQRIQTTSPTPIQRENKRIKSLNIYPPKRKRLLRQTVSSTNTLPMKAIVQLTKESLEICGVSSAPLMKTNSKSVNTIGEGGRLKEIEHDEGKCSDFPNEVEELENSCVMDKEIKVIKQPSQLKRNKSFTVSGLPDNYDPFLSAKRQLEELCSPTSDTVDIPTTPQTPQLPSLPTTPNSSNNNKMTTSLILSSSTPNTTPNLMTTSQIPQQTQKTPTLARSSSFRRTSSLRGPRRSPMLSARPPLFAQKHRPTIQRGLSDEGPISNNFLKPEEYDEMPVRSVCVNDFAANKSPRVVRRDTSTSNRKQPLKLNINAANGHSSSATVSPNVRMEPEVVAHNTGSKYVSKTDSLAVFLKYEHELEKLNQSALDNEHKMENLLEVKTPSTASTITTTPVTNLDGPLNAKELKDKSNNLSKQNSAKNIKADILAASESNENYDINLNTANQQHKTNDVEASKYGQVCLAPLATKPSTPLTKPSTPQIQQQQSTPNQLTPLNIKNSVQQNQEQKAPKSPIPVALSSIFGGGNCNKTTKQSALIYSEHKNTMGSDYIDPKLINKCDNLPINVNLKRTDFKHSDSDTSEPRLEHFSSSSSESSAPAKKPTSLAQHAKFLPTVKQQPQQQQQQQQEQNNNLNINQPQQQPTSVTNSQRNSAEGRNLLKRRMRLGRNQFLYDASPEGDSCSADDEGANRSSLEGDALQHRNLLREQEKAFERLSSIQVNPIDAPFIPPLPAFDDFDFEEFLSSFENDEEQFPLFQDCREFLMNRTSKKQRSMLLPNSAAQNTTYDNTHNNSTNFKKSSSPQTFPPLTPQTQHSTAGQHFQFPSLPQHPKNLFNSFSLNARSRNKYDDQLNATKSTDTFCVNSNSEDFKDLDSSHSINQKREIFISIETEQNDLDKSPISPNSIRNIVGNPQTVVEVEVDAAHDNKFSKISDDDEADTAQNLGRSKNFSGHLMAERLPNVQLNNAKNLIQKMQEDFRQMGEEMSGNLRLTMEHRGTAPVDVNMNTNTTMPASARNMVKMNRTAGTPSGDAYGDSDELSSLDGYPLSSPNSRLGVSSKTSADSAYGSLSRQRSSELTCQRSSSRSRPMTTNTTNTLLNRPLTEETSLGRSRQLSASSSSSSEHALPPITNSNSFHTLQQQQQQQHLYNNNNNIANDLDELMRYERSGSINNNNNNNNYDIQPTHATLLTGATNSHSNLESLQQYPSNSTMSSSMKMSKFCHECGSRFLLEQAKFCMDCGVKRIVL